MTLPLSIDVSALLRCPNCRASLNRRGHGYVCLVCKSTFPQELGVTRFVTAENYADSSGFQWQRYARLDHKFVEWVTALPVEWGLRAGPQTYSEKAGGASRGSVSAAAPQEARLSTGFGGVDED